MSIIKSSILLVFFTGFNIVLSFFNQVVIAYLFGTSWEMDAYLAASALPLTLVGITSGGIGFVIVPMLTRYKDKPNELREAMNALFSLVLLAVLVVILFGGFCGRFVIGLIASQLPAEKLGLAAKLVPMLWVMAALNMASGFLISLQHLNKKFSIAAISLGMPTLGMIAGGLLFSRRMGINSIVAGGVAGSIIQVLVLLTATGCLKWFRLSFNFRRPEIKNAIFNILPLAGSLLPFTIFPVIDVFWAAGLPDGSISYLGYSTRIAIVLTTIASHGISVVIFPFLSEIAVSGEMANLKEMVIKSIRTIYLVVFPMIVIVIILKEPLAKIIFERGSFGSDSTAGITRVLPFYLLGMVGTAPMYIIIRAFYSLQDFTGSAILGLAGTVLYFLLGGLLVRHFSYMGLGFAYAIHWVIMFVVNCFVLGRKIGKIWNIEDLIFLAKIAAGALITGVLVMLICKLLDTHFDVIISTALPAVAGMLIFYIIHMSLIKIKEMEIITRAIVCKLGI
jgi:putative peptidoglycan lipid II flippase